MQTDIYTDRAVPLSVPGSGVPIGKMRGPRKHNKKMMSAVGLPVVANL